MPGYIVYVDAWLVRLLANFIFEFLLLWATAEVTRTVTTRTRLFLASLVGTIHYLLFLMSSLRLIPYYGIISFFPTILVVSAIMLAVAFGPIPRRRFLRVIGYFYAIGFASAGAGIGASYLLGTPSHPRQTLGMAVAIATILAIAELGWGIVQKRIIQHVYEVPVEIVWQDKKVRLLALVDTGNKLRDPLSQQPVMVVDHKILKSLFTPEIEQMIKSLESGDLQAITSLVGTDPLASRFRVIPYSSIGKENGLLIGFRPCQVRLFNTEVPQSTTEIVVGIHNRNLDPEGNYQALIPPEVLHTTLASSAQIPNLQRGGRSHAASTHSEV